MTLKGPVKTLITASIIDVVLLVSIFLLNIALLPQLAKVLIVMGTWISFLIMPAFITALLLVIISKNQEKIPRRSLYVILSVLLGLLLAALPVLIVLSGGIYISPAW